MKHIKSFITTTGTFFIWRMLEFMCVNHNEIFEMTMKTITNVLNTL